MKILKLKPHLTDNELKNKLKSSKTADELRRWQCLYLVQSQKGITAHEISKILCISVPTIYLYVETYNKYGAERVKPKRKGGRRRFYLSMEEEREILKNAAKKAIEGKIITAKEIKKEVEKKIGHVVSDDYLWDLFKRHNWSKKKPRPKHPKSSEKEQEAFKKNSKMIWMPPE